MAFQELFRISQAVILAMILTRFESSQSNSDIPSDERAYIYVGIWTGLFILVCGLDNMAEHYSKLVGLQIQVALSGTVFRKVCRE